MISDILAEVFGRILLAGVGIGAGVVAVIWFLVWLFN
jgi:hypothetical protein